MIRSCKGALEVPEGTTPGGSSTGWHGQSQNRGCIMWTRPYIAGVWPGRRRNCFKKGGENGGKRRKRRKRRKKKPVFYQSIRKKTGLF